MKISFTIVFVLLNIACFTQDKLLTGQIVNQITKEPVKYAHVILNYKQKEYGAISDSAGRFLFKISPIKINGEILQVTALGFHDSFSLFNGQKDYKIGLVPKIYQIEEVKIIAKDFIKVISVNPPNNSKVSKNMEINFLITYYIKNYSRKRFEIPFILRIKDSDLWIDDEYAPKIKVNKRNDTIQFSYPVKHIDKFVQSIHYPYNLTFLLHDTRTDKVVAWSDIFIYE